MLREAGKSKLSPISPIPSPASRPAPSVSGLVAFYDTDDGNMSDLTVTGSDSETPIGRPMST
jgi:hypothetical protein